MRQSLQEVTIFLLIELYKNVTSPVIVLIKSAKYFYILLIKNKIQLAIKSLMQQNLQKSSLTGNMSNLMWIHQLIRLRTSRMVA